MKVEYAKVRKAVLSTGSELLSAFVLQSVIQLLDPFVALITERMTTNVSSTYGHVGKERMYPFLTWELVVSFLFIIPILLKMK